MPCDTYVVVVVVRSIIQLARRAHGTACELADHNSCSPLDLLLGFVARIAIHAASSDATTPNTI